MIFAHLIEWYFLPLLVVPIILLVLFVIFANKRLKKIPMGELAEEELAAEELAESH